MALTDKEQRLLEKLTQKANAPERAPAGRTVNFSIDLGDAKQVALAIKHGLLDADEVEDDSDDDEDPEDTPKRGGFFGDK